MDPQLEPDSFGEFLNDLGTLPATRQDLAESIFAQTRGVLSWRRWLRRGRIVLACLLCYGVGIGSGWLLKPGAALQVAGQPQGAIGNPPVKPGPPLTKDAQPLDAKVNGPTATDTKITDSRVAVPKPTVARASTSQFESFRRAGDRQLFERGNIHSAMDCYRRALTHATEQELHVEIDRDSWLLMSLKQSRMEERKHVRQKRA